MNAGTFGGATPFLKSGKASAVSTSLEVQLQELLIRRINYYHCMNFLHIVILPTTT